MKKLFTASLLFLLYSFQAQGQAICNPSGNLLIYSNYDGGVLNISVDQNIPNIRIGICTYEPVTINISGPFVGNVIAVRYAGYVSTNNNHCSNSPTTTTINGVSPGITSINFLPPATLSNPNGYSMIVCNYSCNTTSNQGGCNTADQIADYFETTMGGLMRYHFTQYGCWSISPYLMSAGGNCCAGATNCNYSVDAGADQNICSGSSVQLNCAGSGNCTWSPSVGLSNANICNPVASPIATMTYIVTCDSAGCQDSDTIVVNVDSAMIVCLATIPNFCVNDPPTPITFCTPDNGTWTGPGVSNNEFTASVAGAGTHTLGYSVTDTTNGCSASGTMQVMVHPAPIVTIYEPDTICDIDTSIVLTGSPSGGVFAGPGVTGNQFNPINAGTGLHTITYTATSTFGCEGSATTTILVVANPATPSISQSGQVLTCSPPGDNYQWFQNGVPVSTSGPSFTPVATGSYTVMVQQNGCWSDTSASFFFELFGTTDPGNWTLQIYPNPGTGIFEITLERGTRINKISVFDLAGRLIREESGKLSGDKLRLNLTQLPEGQYLVVIDTPQGIRSGRVIKQ